MSESQDPSLPINGGYSLRTTSDNTEAAWLGERHAQFIECLERHGPDFTGDEWPILAEELGWSTEEVQLHAYQYLTCLMEADETQDAQAPENGGSRRAVNGERENGSGAPWIPAECILFDSLIGTYRTTNSSGNSNNNDWDEVVAAHMPGRTVREVRRRYRQLYGNSNAQADQ
jgi:hypothetical protein